MIIKYLGPYTFSFQLDINCINIKKASDYRVSTICVKDENICYNKFNEHTNMSNSPKSSSRIKEVIQHKMKAVAEAEEKSERSLQEPLPISKRPHPVV